MIEYYSSYFHLDFPELVGEKFKILKEESEIKIFPIIDKNNNYHQFEIRKSKMILKIKVF